MWRKFSVQCIFQTGLTIPGEAANKLEFHCLRTRCGGGEKGGVRYLGLNGWFKIALNSNVDPK